MGRYVTIHQEIKEDEDFLDLSNHAQRAWFMLRFDPRLGISGVGRIAVRRMLELINLPTEKEALGVLEELTKPGPGGTRVRYDRDTGVIWIRGSFAHEPNSQNVRKSALTELERLPASPIILEWIEMYRDRYDQTADNEKTRKSIEEQNARLERLSETVSKRLVNGLGTVPEPFRNRSETVSEPSNARAHARVRVPDPPGPDRTVQGVLENPPRACARDAASAAAPAGVGSRASARPPALDPWDAPPLLEQLDAAARQLLGDAPKRSARDRKAAKELAAKHPPAEIVRRYRAMLAEQGSFFRGGQVWKLLEHWTTWAPRRDPPGTNSGERAPALDTRPRGEQVAYARSRLRRLREIAAEDDPELGAEIRELVERFPELAREDVSC